MPRDSWYGTNVPMHPIRKYLERLGISQREFARRAGVKPSSLNDVIQGRSHLGRENALNVVRITGGEVTLEELLTWKPASAVDSDGAAA